MLSHPFMQRAALAGAMLALLLPALGAYVTLRRMTFFGDGIAHSSLAGIAIAILAGAAPLPVAIVWAIGVALLVARLERSTRLPSDTLIGVLFTASMALGVVLMSLTRGYQPELVTYLFGSILSIRDADLAIIAALSALILVWLYASRRPLAYLSLAEESARVAGVPVRLLISALYVALAIAAVLGVKILGIILVSALIALPPAISRLTTSSFRGFVVGSVIAAELMMAFGLTISYRYDLPSGATVVLVGAAAFFFAVLFASPPHAHRRHRA